MSKRTPRVLFYDIETGPNLAYVWGKYEQDVIAFVNEWELLSFAFRWQGEGKVISYGRDKHTEKELVKELWKLFDEADIVIAHNGDQFDQRMSNAKFLEFGLLPPSPYRTVDTLKVARRYFRFNSNKLDDLGQLLGLGRKVKTGGFDLWKGCLANDPKSWVQMLRYNRQDVILLEKVYGVLRPWIENHPSVGTMQGNPDACEVCGGTKLHNRGYRYTNKRRYERLRCTNCGHWQKGAYIKFA